MTRSDLIKDVTKMLKQRRKDIEKENAIAARKNAKLKKEDQIPTTYFSDEDQVRFVIVSMIDLIKEKLLFGINVNLTNLVDFKLVISPAQTKYNPHSGETMEVPKRYRVKMNMPKSFTDKIREKTVY